MGRLRIVTWLALLGGPIMIGGGGYEYWRLVQLRDHGVCVVGKLHDSGTRSTGKGRTVYWVHVDYQPQAGSPLLRKEFFIPEKLYDEVRKVGKVPIIYAPNDPAESIAGDTITPPTEPLAIGFGLIIAGIVAWYYRRRKLAEVEAYVHGAGPW